MSALRPFNIRNYWGNSSCESNRAKNCTTLLYTVIGINTMVFVGWQFANSSRDQNAMKVKRFLTENFLLSLQHLKEGRWSTLITSEFSHINLAHFGFNMFAFYQMSQVLVYTPGVTPLSIATLIFGSALAASAGFLGEASVDQHQRKVGLGASGIVSGITASVALLAPKLTVLVFGVVPMPMWVFGVGTIVYDTYFLGGNTGIGHSAHLGGAAFGVLYYFLRLRKFKGFGRF
ncbi:hypothetical protein EJ08DRAFT_650353 [Tothia fuscella]|uniref:Peptidase S54 rhomboid domain-containing protein n=1 Tax=Tothia fuscella TaxID=1048955 RepID=A0A9P4NPY7_9PEZI|nr:hypothetical protein EJ08DRAFT_650353 [Tothia fuscella]